MIQPNITHEPIEPGKPDERVTVQQNTMQDLEALTVTIHGHIHYLFASTATELAKQLISQLHEFAAQYKAIHPHLKYEIDRLYYDEDDCRTPVDV